jgi:hypothetical protein
MKKLVMPIVMCAVVLCAGRPALAQSKDLAGTWAFDAEKSSTKDGPPSVVLALSATELKVTMGKADALLFTLDGKETPMANGGKTKAQWQGNKLVATLISKGGESESITFFRNGELLVMEGQSRQHGPMTLYFKRAPVKL